MADGAVERTVRLPFALDLARTLQPLRHGPHDPCCQTIDGAWWRASRSPAGAVTIRLVAHTDRIVATAWGEGADAALDVVPNLVGLNDPVDDFRPGRGLVQRLWDRFGGLRIPRSGAVAESVLAHLVERGSTSFESRRAQAQMVERWGGPAPGPTTLCLPPDPQAVAGASHYDLHLVGAEQVRGDALRRAAANARRLDTLALLPPAEAHQRLAEVAGVDPWTAARVALDALGDADAVPLGDPAVAAAVTGALCGEPSTDDNTLLEALEPYAGHRGRVLRLLELNQP